MRCTDEVPLVAASFVLLELPSIRLEGGELAFVAEIVRLEGGSVVVESRHWSWRMFPVGAVGTGRRA